MPSTLRRRLRYSDYTTATGTAGIIGTWVFVANGLYDPDFTFSGHQPMAFDQYMALYANATVLSSRCTVDCVAVSVPVCFGVAVMGGSSSGYSSYSSFLEAGNCRYRLLDTETDSGNRVTVAVDIPRWLGIQDPVEETTLACTASANATQNLYFHVFAQDVNKTSTLNAELSVVLEFDVVFHNPKILGTS